VYLFKKRIVLNSKLSLIFSTSNKGRHHYSNLRFNIFIHKKISVVDNQLTPFEGKDIRKVWLDEQWFFSIIDIIQILTDSPNPSRYWTNLKNQDKQLYPNTVKLKLVGLDGRARPSDCANTEGVFRILMSVPSPKAEPFKLWLANLGKQAIEEAENPEILTERQAELYRAKGYSEEWITRRVQTIETRKALTDEWQQRGVRESQEYAILTAMIAKATFGITPTEHKEIKGLNRQNLRDHMTPLELIFTALGEEMTRAVTTRDDAQGFNENHDAAQKGGELAGKALENLEMNYGEKVVSSTNYLSLKSQDVPPELPA
jgi:prophage antirepressor-like protein